MWGSRRQLAFRSHCQEGFSVPEWNIKLKGFSKNIWKLHVPGQDYVLVGGFHSVLSVVYQSWTSWVQFLPLTEVGRGYQANCLGVREWPGSPALYQIFRSSCCLLLFTFLNTWFLQFLSLTARVALLSPDTLHWRHSGLQLLHSVRPLPVFPSPGRVCAVWLGVREGSWIPGIWACIFVVLLMRWE